MIYDILTDKIINVVTKFDYSSIEEIRITSNVAISLVVDGKYVILDELATQSDVNQVLARVTRNSLYAVNDTIVQGYVSYDGGLRVGIAGEYVYDDGKIKTIKNVNSIIIRIPRNNFGVANEFIDKIVTGATVKNTLFVGPPLSGKTSILREIARNISVNKNLKVVIIDEKNEISATQNGKSYLDVGRSVVCVGAKRWDGVENAVRNLSPHVIITDEIYGMKDIECIDRCLRSGIGVVTSMHGKDVCNDICNLFDYVVGLSNNPIGSVLWEKIND